MAAHLENSHVVPCARRKVVEDMRQSAARSILLAIVVLAGCTVAAQGKPQGPEDVIRSLVLAIYGNDVASYNGLTIPHPMRSRLTSGGRANQDKLNALKEDPQSLQIIPKRSPTFRGEEAKPDAQGQYPVGTTALYVVSHGGGPMVVTLAQRAEGWKVDLRWWIAMTELASRREPARDSPEVAIRSLLAAMLQLDRSGASRFAAPGTNMDALFDGAPRQREPSGVLESTVFEMPLVELEPGEFVRTPSGKLVEGTQAPDRKVLVGQFGPVEIPFVLRRVKEWRVEGEPYFMLMMQ